MSIRNLSRYATDRVLRKIIVLVALVIATAGILVGESYLGRRQTSECSARHDNQHACQSLGRSIRMQLIQVESVVQKLAATEDARNVDLLQQEILTLKDSIERALTVLSVGGIYESTVRLNLNDIDTFHETVFYRKAKDDRIVIAVVELAPKLVDLENGVALLVAAVQGRHEAVDAQSRADLDKVVALRRKQVEATLLRAGENANKIYYDTSQRLEAIEHENHNLATQIQSGENITAVLIVFICVIVGVATLRHVAQILDERRTARRDLKKHYDRLDEMVNERTEELRESEQRVQAILDHTQAGIMVIDAETHRVVDINRFAMDKLDITRGQVIGKGCHEIVCSAVEGQCPISDLGHEIDNAEHQLLHADGGQITVLKTVAKASIKGRPCFVESFVDISDKRRLETELLHAQKMESVGHLAAGIAHEINTPIQYVGDNIRFLADSINDLLGLVGSFQELFREGGSSADGTDHTERIALLGEDADLEYLELEVPKAVEQGLAGVERVSRIVLAMKGFSHPGTEDKAPTNLNEAIETTIIVCRNEWKYVAEIVTEFDPALPLVSCLVGEFNQVILNMIVNAAHAIADVVVEGEQDKGTITISTRQDGDWVEVRIADTGSGIPEEHRDNVFDHFFTTKGVGKGTGQGLAIAHSVITKTHGGTVTLESEMGQGTTFIVRLPIETAPEPTIELVSS